MENEILHQILDELKGVNQRLDSLEHGQTKLEQSVAKLEQGQAKLEQSVAKLENDVSSIKEDVSSIRGSVVIMENEYGMKIGALYDGYINSQKDIKRIEPLEERVDSLETRVWVLEQA